MAMLDLTELEEAAAWVRQARLAAAVAQEQLRQPRTGDPLAAVLEALGTLLSELSDDRVPRPAAGEVQSRREGGIAWGPPADEEE